MARSILTLALALQLVCCPIECQLGVCGCRSMNTASAPSDNRCDCCQNRDRGVLAGEERLGAIGENESQVPPQPKPIPDQPGPRKNKNCICHGALKSDASGEWNIAQEIAYLVSIEAPTAIGNSNLPLIRRWVFDSGDPFFFLTGRQIRAWQQSFLC